MRFPLWCALGVVCFGGAAPAHAGEYELNYESLSWPDARAACAAAGSELASPKTEDEFKALQKLARSMHYPSIQHASSNTRVMWLGVSDLERCGEDIEPMDFLVWLNTTHCDPKEPHCAVIDAINPSLRTFWCHYSLPYICEKKT